MDALDGIGGAAGAWLIAALVLGIAELAVPGVFLVFLAIAAAVTGVAVFALPDLPVAAQLAAFAVWSAVTVLIGKRWYRDYPVEGGDPMLNDRSARLVGHVVVVETAIVGGRGRVLVGDGSWPARGKDAGVGARVRVAAVVDGEVVVELL
ncbi:NfeD family protein [Sphingomonas albertensis]|uniref:NfeD family protein n=1 Tax=Sphingomonas albertensis TaxID=2762591 RepID=A0ABR7AS24_9SPHN|nr:NfeD family protein [Sphingomonas albertensis]MBC3943261.1 NfeD family protein [Sphingomonas albertensis]